MSNGQRGSSETRLAGVAVQLYACGTPGSPGTLVQHYKGVTDAQGRYQFQLPPFGEYALVFDVSGLADAAEYVYTIQNVEGNTLDDVDSDSDSTGVASCITIASLATARGSDAGLFKDADGDFRPDGSELDILAGVADPTGIIYCEHTGEIIQGGLVGVTGPGNVFMLYNGNSGYYGFYVDKTGEYTITFTVPTGYVRSIDCTEGESLPVTGLQIEGSGDEDGDGFVDAYDCESNPYSLTVTLSPGDFLTNNNLPLQCLDLGDAPEAYDVLIEDNGARHAVLQTPNLYIGSLVDIEADGQPDVKAGMEGGGDDGSNPALDDEDGIGEMPVFIITVPTTLDIPVVNNTGSAATLHIFIDYNGNGSWSDAGEYYSEDVPVGHTGPISVTLTPPVTAIVGVDVGLRLRLSTDPELGPTGFAPDGEIEDYVVLIAGFDYGDLPQSYNTSGTNNPVAAIIDADLMLGASVDAEIDGAPDALAKGDDLDPGLVTFGTASVIGDEDGIELMTPLIPGYEAAIRVSAINNKESAAVLQGWIDWNGNGSFEAEEELLSGSFAGGGATVPVGGLSAALLSFDVPEGAVFSSGVAMSRFRLSEAGGLSGMAQEGTPPFGEVEDYAFILHQRGNLVWEDVNGNGLQDAGEPGLEGVTVELTYYGEDGTEGGSGFNADRSYEAQTDAEGYYTFWGLKSGEYRLRIPELPAFHVPTALNLGQDDAKDSEDPAGHFFSIVEEPMGPVPTFTRGVEAMSGVEFPEEQLDESIDFGLLVLAKLGDYAWVDVNLDGLQGADELPLVDVQLRLVGTDNLNRPVDTILYTDEEGNYLFEDLWPGTYEIRVSLDSLSSPVALSRVTRYLVFMDAFVGDDEGLDSDVDPDTRVMSGYVLVSQTDIRTADAGVRLPMPSPDINPTMMGYTASGNLGTNDLLSQGATYGPAVPGAGNPAGGQLELNPDGTYTFTSTSAGTFVYEITMCPEGITVNCPTATLVIVSMDPTSTQNEPMANSDLAITRQDRPVTINTLANDDPFLLGTTLDPTTVMLVTPPMNGTVSIDPVTGDVTYTPNPGFIGEDRWTCVVCGFGEINTPTGTLGSTEPVCRTFFQEVRVMPNGAPNAILPADDYVSTLSGVDVSGNVLTNDMDLNGEELSVIPQEVTWLGIGRISLLADGSFDFDPHSSFFGPVSLPYVVCSPVDDICSEATLYILVVPACKPVSEMQAEQMTDNSARLSWKFNNDDIYQHCWTVTVGGQGYDGSVMQSVQVFTICSWDEGVTVEDDRVYITITGLMPGTCYQYTVTETCNEINEESNTSPVALSTAFCTFDTPATVTSSWTTASCPSVSPGFTPDGTITLTITHSTTCMTGLYQIVLPGETLDAQALGNPVGAGTYTFNGYGPGEHTFTIYDVSGSCDLNPALNPVVVQVEIPEAPDTAAPSFTVRDNQGTTAPTAMAYTLPEGSCSVEQYLFVRGTDSCDGDITATNAVTTTITMSPASVVPGSTGAGAIPGRWAVPDQGAVCGGHHDHDDNDDRRERQHDLADLYDYGYRQHGSGSEPFGKQPVRDSGLRHADYGDGNGSG
jgi:hypothetical protein